MNSDSIAKEIILILSKQSQSNRPSPDVCMRISEISCGFNDTKPSLTQNDWRKNPHDRMKDYTKAKHSDYLTRQGNSNTSTPNPSLSDSVVNSPLSSHGGTPTPIVKYQSRFKNSQQNVEDKILNNIILSKLNKFSKTTYNEVRDFLYQILGSGGSEVEEIVPHFIRLVFKKAASEKMFCPLYAKLLSEISSRYGIILTEMQRLQANYLNIFDDITENKSESYMSFLEIQKSKEFRHGYSQFLAELTALELLSIDLLNSTFKCIIENMIHFGKLPENKALLEEYSDCLVSMAKVLKKPGLFFSKSRSKILSVNQENINHMIDNHTEYVSETAKTRFILMDIRDILMCV